MRSLVNSRYCTQKLQSGDDGVLTEANDSMSLTVRQLVYYTVQ